MKFVGGGLGADKSFGHKTVSFLWYSFLIVLSYNIFLKSLIQNIFPSFELPVYLIYFFLLFTYPVILSRKRFFMGSLEFVLSWF